MRGEGGEEGVKGKRGVRGKGWEGGVKGGREEEVGGGRDEGRGRECR